METFIFLYFIMMVHNYLNLIVNLQLTPFVGIWVLVLFQNPFRNLFQFFLITFFKIFITAAHKSCCKPIEWVPLRAFKIIKWKYRPSLSTKTIKSCALINLNINKHKCWHTYYYIINDKTVLDFTKPGSCPM